MGMITTNITTDEIRTLRGEITETSDTSLIEYVGKPGFLLITVSRKYPVTWSKSDNHKYIAEYGNMFATFENIEKCNCLECANNL